MNIMDANGAIACAECAKNARNERDQLQAENAKLRKQLRDTEYEDELYGLRCAIGALQAENAKLRELVRRMLCAVHPADREKFLTNVAELGVEMSA